MVLGSKALEAQTVYPRQNPHGLSILPFVHKYPPRRAHVYKFPSPPCVCLNKLPFFTDTPPPSAHDFKIIEYSDSISYKRTQYVSFLMTSLL